jgi:hypothetical protein
MAMIATKVRVAQDGTISGKAPSAVPPGEHDAQIIVREEGTTEKGSWVLPVHNWGPWPEGFSLRREDTYGDDGR